MRAQVALWEMPYLKLPSENVCVNNSEGSQRSNTIIDHAAHLLTWYATDGAHAPGQAMTLELTISLIGHGLPRDAFGDI
jgi:hypothetical protein